MIYDLDNILITERVYDSWLGYLPFAIKDLQGKFKKLSPREIPDEQLREFTDGSAEIFVTIRGQEIKMAVPKGEWSKR
jgi:hypothetical protein